MQALLLLAHSQFPSWFYYAALTFLAAVGTVLGVSVAFLIRAVWKWLQ